MLEYDIALKTFLHRAPLTLLAIAGVDLNRWHNVEMPEVRNRRVDLLGESADERLVHIELQSTHDPIMALRMMEYCADIYRRFGRFPEQVVLYVGEAPLRMENSLTGPCLSFQYRILDIRELDGERLLNSDQIGDNVIAVLARVRNKRAAVRRILRSIAAGDPSETANALTGFLMLAGLRQLGDTVEKEAGQMPLLDDILDHPVLGREYKRGLKQGIEQGLERGKHAGELTLLLRQVERRFGTVPAALRERFAAMSDSEIESIALRLLDAHSLEDLLV